MSKKEWQAIALEIPVFMILGYIISLFLNYCGLIIQLAFYLGPEEGNIVEGFPPIILTVVGVPITTILFTLLMYPLVWRKFSQLNEFMSRMVSVVLLTIILTFATNSILMFLFHRVWI
ncbi:MAG: hypothetical protein AAF490_25715 [Chloroflexota bacterium]